MNACARIVALAFACCFSLSAVAQEKSAKPDDLDVTMQIIVDPNAKLPDEVVRRIPLPAPRASVDKATRPGDAKTDESKARERANEARELGREAAERAKERAREAADAREDARNSDADRGKDKDKDKDKDRDDRDRPGPNPPGPPPRP